MNVIYSDVVITPPANAVSTSTYHGTLFGRSVTVTYTAEPQTIPTIGTVPLAVTYRVEVPIQAVEPSQSTNIAADITFPISSPPNQSSVFPVNLTAIPTTSSASESNVTPTVTASSVTSTVVSNSSSSFGADPTGTASISSLSASRASDSSSVFVTSIPITGAVSVSTSASSTNSNSTPLAAQRGAGNSTAELAGIAIGCLVGGALVASLIFFLLFRRRRSRHDLKSSSSERELSPLNGHGEAIYLASGYEKIWGKQLPSSTSDISTSNTARGTLNQIETLVDNLYHDKHGLDLSIEAQSELEDLDSSHLPASILTLISQAKRPSLLIKHCLINFILSRITPGGTRAAASFLPKEFAGMETSSQTHAEIARDQALAQWRVLTAYLKHNFTQDETYTTERDQAIATAAQQVCRAFEPWARSDHNTCLQAITSVMKRASELGIMLCSQQTSFEWRWEVSNNDDLLLATRREPMQIVVRPGLDRTTDMSAVPMTVALHLFEPYVAVLDRI